MRHTVATIVVYFMVALIAPFELILGACMGAWDSGKQIVSVLRHPQDARFWRWFVKKS
jgi:hypothetical protein